MIDREQARAIAEAEVKRGGYGAGVRSVVSGGEAADLDGVYLAGQDRRVKCWFAYVDPSTLRVGASTVVAISKQDGRIVAVGSEGE